MKLKLLLILLLAALFSCSQESKKSMEADDVYQSGKPYTRWWWFASEINNEDIRAQLVWLKKKNFGGVEIAFIYPVGRDPEAKRIKWLSAEWTAAVTYAKKCADSLGLGCDFTFGTLWPFGGTFVADSDRTKVYGDTSFKQPLRLSWTHPDTGNVLDHLNRGAFERYASTMGEALKPALEGSTSALFCDSWEVETRKIWADDFADEFKKRNGYDITAYMYDIYSEQFSDARYDYMKLAADMVLNRFYKHFTERCHELGALSRVQCAGSPTDLISAYASVDIPETEAMLYEPNYSKITASAAALSSKKIVTSETFTCLYGWPGDYHRREQTADLKLVADALFANGVNQIIWHGKPYNPKGVDTNYFYATVHVGKKGALADELGEFNKYMTKVSKIMRKGRTYSDAAVYLPLEDAWYAGEYPEEKQMKWSWGAYELRYKYMPEELEGYHPLWINGHFLKKGKIKDGKLHCGDVEFSSLYVDVNYLDIETLERILNIAKKGFPICLKHMPEEAGKNKSLDFRRKLNELFNLKNVSSDFNRISANPPLIKAYDKPAYWARVVGEELYIFFAHPKAKKLKYPLEYGQSYAEESMLVPAIINYNDSRIRYPLKFEPYQSVVLKIGVGGSVEKLDIYYKPDNPKKNLKLAAF